LISYFSLNQLIAQSVSISNDNNSQADSSFILDVKSDYKGMLIPRLLSIQREAINEPATGLMVFDTDSNAFCFYDGISWQFITTVAYVDSIKQEIKLEIYAELGVSDV
jgi:hypothetical protein